MYSDLPPEAYNEMGKMFGRAGKKSYRLAAEHLGAIVGPSVAIMDAAYSKSAVEAAGIGLLAAAAAHELSHETEFMEAPSIETIE